MSEAENKKVKPSGRKNALGTMKGPDVFVENGIKTARGTEVWHVRADGKTLSLTTSATSTAIMDDAVKIYSPALKRLAKR